MIPTVPCIEGGITDITWLGMSKDQSRQSQESSDIRQMISVFENSWQASYLIAHTSGPFIGCSTFFFYSSCDGEHVRVTLFLMTAHYIAWEINGTSGFRSRRFISVTQYARLTSRKRVDFVWNIFATSNR